MFRLRYNIVPKTIISPTLTIKDKPNIRVPYGCSVHGEEEIAAVIAVLRSSTQMGSKVRSFERKIAETFGKAHGVMVNSGSSALFLSVEILDIPNGMEVITPALTFATTVSCLVKTGLVPSFVDAEEGTFCIDSTKIEPMISEKTRAVCIPNLIGNLPSWREIHALCRKYKLKIIEDSADTLGATLNGEPTGTFSDISITSFYGSHIINAAGNGGMLCSDDQTLTDKARLLRSWGRSSSLFIDSENIDARFNVKVDGMEYDAKFVFEEIGYNLEPSEIGAAFGLVQLKYLQQNIVQRERNFNLQYNFFRGYEDFFLLPKKNLASRTGWLAFPLVVKPGAPFTRRDMQIYLERCNIQTRTIFTGNILRQPGFARVKKRTSAEGYPVADDVMRGGILLACHQGLSDDMIAHMHSTARKFLDQY